MPNDWDGDPDQYTRGGDGSWLRYLSLILRTPQTDHYGLATFGALRYFFFARKSCFMNMWMLGMHVGNSTGKPRVRFYPGVECVSPLNAVARNRWRAIALHGTESTSSC